MRSPGQSHNHKKKLSNKLQLCADSSRLGHQRDFHISAHQTSSATTRRPVSALWCRSTPLKANRRHPTIDAIRRQLSLSLSCFLSLSLSFSCACLFQQARNQREVMVLIAHSICVSVLPSAPARSTDFRRSLGAQHPSFQLLSLTTTAWTARARPPASTSAPHPWQRRLWYTRREQQRCRARPFRRTAPPRC